VVHVPSHSLGHDRITTGRKAPPWFDEVHETYPGGEEVGKGRGRGKAGESNKAPVLASIEEEALRLALKVKSTKIDAEDRGSKKDGKKRGAKAS
jgi:hypothetical protein